VALPEEREQVLGVVRRRRRQPVPGEPSCQQGRHGYGGDRGHGPGVAEPRPLPRQTGEVRVQRRVETPFAVHQRLQRELVGDDHDHGTTVALDAGRGDHVVVAPQGLGGGRGEDEHRQEQQRGRGDGHDPPPDHREAQVGHRDEHRGAGDGDGQATAGHVSLQLQELEHRGRRQPDDQDGVQQPARPGVDAGDAGLDRPEDRGRHQQDEEPERHEVGAPRAVGQEHLRRPAEGVVEGLGHGQAAQGEELDRRSHQAVPLGATVHRRRG
jgi:hypothetical protein